MKDFCIEDLESLAAWLDKGAGVANAKAGEYAMQSDKQNVDRQCKRADRLAFWAATCREAQRRLKKRGRKGE